MFHDLRVAARQLRKSRGFAVTTVLTLGLGIGATAAMFSLVHAVVLRPLPFPEPDRLVFIQQGDTAAGTPAAPVPEPFSYPNFFDWRAGTRSFTGMGSYRSAGFTLTGAGEPRRLNGLVVSPNLFRVLGASPALGRDFRDEEERAGSRAVMLSYGLWRSAFGGSPDIAGRTVNLNDRSYTVAGVMPAGFSFPYEASAGEVWTTLGDDAEGANPFTGQRGNECLEVVGRLKPGVTISQARADLSVIARRLAAEYPDSNKPRTAAIVRPELDEVVGDSRRPLMLLFAAVSLVLLIACANVAGLLVARSSRRRGEIAVRAALGARRSEIVRQVLAESVMLSLLGGVLGVGLSSWILDTMLHFVPSSLPRAEEVSVDGTVLAFVTVVSVVTGLLFGVLPAWKMAGVDPSLALRDAGRGTAGMRGQHRLHAWLVVGETALGLVLLLGSGLLIRSFIRVLHVDPGFDPRHVLTADLYLTDQRHPAAEKVRFYGRLLPEVAALPGVQSVAAGFPLPLSDNHLGVSFEVEGHVVPPGDEPSAAVSTVTPGFFRTMRIPVLAGREFTERDDRQGTPAIIVNEAFAKKYFAGVNPVGRRVRSDLSDGEGKPPVREVVGVVGNVKHAGLVQEPEPQYYLPWAQAVITSPALVIRTAGDPAALASALRARMEDLDRNVPLYHVRPLAELVSSAASARAFQTLVLGCFAAMALLLSALGLYSVLSYMVAQRTAEIGLRVALGAARGDVMRLVVARGLGLALAGLGIGAGLAALVTGRFLSGMLYTVEPYDALTAAAVSALLLAVAAAASLAPAIRAARLDPLETLREQ